MAESDFLYATAIRLEELAQRFEVWPQLSPDVIMAERPQMVDELVEIKQQLENIGVIGPYASSEDR